MSSSSLGTSGLRHVPHARLQPDWHDVVYDVRTKETHTVPSKEKTVVSDTSSLSSFWAYHTSLRKGGAVTKPTHSRIKISRSSQADSNDKVTFACDTPSFSIAFCDAERKRPRFIDACVHDDVAEGSEGGNATVTRKTRFYAPSNAIRDLTKAALFSVDVSPMGGLGVVGGEGGMVRVFEADTGVSRRELTEDGHVGDVNVSKFFPSGEVVLSGGSDYRLKVWSVAGGFCAATLTGHTLGVLSAAFIDRGKSLVSASRDGTVRIWDVSTKSTLAVCCQSDTRGAINDVCVAARDDHHLCIAAGEDGVLTGVDTRQPTVSVFRTVLPSPVNACAFTSSSSVVAACHDGTVSRFDIRNLNAEGSDTPVYSFNRGESPVSSVVAHPHHESMYWVATTDGQGYLFDEAKNRSVYELSGSDYDPLYDMCVHVPEAYSPVNGGEASVYTACRDGRVRAYRADDRL